MPEYTPPAEEFSANQAARNRATAGAMFRDELLSKYRRQYEAFWQPPRSHGDLALTMAEMQAVLDEKQDTFQAILADSAAIMQFFGERYSEAFEGDDPKMPARYMSSAYEYHVDASGRVVLDSLKPEWEAT